MLLSIILICYKNIVKQHETYIKYLYLLRKDQVINWSTQRYILPNMVMETPKFFTGAPVRFKGTGRW